MAETKASESTDKTASEAENKPSKAQTEPNPISTKDKGDKGLERATEAQTLTDRHGQDAVAKGKYERDIAAKDKEIESLKAKVEEAAKSEESRKKLTDEIDALKAEIGNLTVNHKLETAGCRSIKAARALLDDFDGDIAKLKDANPWLFDDGLPKGTTGLKPQGAADDAATRLAKARQELGLPPKKKE